MEGLDCTIVILGASGDLARRKLVPALQRLFELNKIGPACRIIGAGRTPFTDETFRGQFSISGEFSRRLFYHQGIPGLKERVRKQGGSSPVFFFLSQPPSVYAESARQLAAEGFGPEASLIVEKPFGYDYQSARELNRNLTRYFPESQLYRIDHYLGKEAVQNILVFRFANSIFEPLWNSRHIESIQISALESIGVGSRGVYFDQYGIIRDMVQNHLMQLLCLTAMEPPEGRGVEQIRTRKIEVIRSLNVLECRRFQYTGYRQEKNVAPDSGTETFAEMVLSIDMPRWQRVPVYLRTGKRAGRAGTEIGIRFRPRQHLLFDREKNPLPNQVIFKIQPAAGIILDIVQKVPGSDGETAPATMKFCFRDAFTGEVPEAYQRLLLDALQGDHTLFVSAEETEAAWQRLEGVPGSGPLEFYAAGTTPAGRPDIPWIDFAQYGPLCA